MCCLCSLEAELVATMGGCRDGVSLPSLSVAYAERVALTLKITTVRHLLPRGQPFDEICRHLLNHDVLENLDYLEGFIVRDPRFDGLQ